MVVVGPEAQAQAFVAIEAQSGDPAGEFGRCVRAAQCCLGCGFDCHPRDPGERLHGGAESLLIPLVELLGAEAFERWMPVDDFDAFLPFPTLQGFAAVARAGVAGRPRGEERDSARFRQFGERGSGRGIEATDQGEGSLIDQGGGFLRLADSQLQECALGGGGVLGRRQNLSEEEMACLRSDEPPSAGPGESSGGELEKAAAAGHRSVYRYAAMCRASVWPTPRLGMAVPRSIPWGSSIQRIMLSGELGSWPPR